MAIAYGEYGPYDTVTGQPVYGNEAGTFFMDGTPYNPNSSTPLPDSAYIVRGNYRMPNVGFGGSRMGGGQLEVRDANGNWVPVTAETAPAGYDPRQDSNAQGSNERLRFDQAFTNAPADVPITGMQQWAIANGWQEPDRSRNEGTLGAMFSNIAPYAALMAGGIGAMGGFAGGLGAASGGLDAASLAAGDAMAGAIPAGELGAWTGASAAGTTAGSGAMDWSNLGDLWNAGGGGTEFAPQNVVDLFNNAGMPGYSDYGQSLDELAAELFNNAGTAGYDQYGNPASGLDWIKSQFGGPGSSTSSATNALKTLFGGGGSGGGTDWMKLLGGLGAAGLGAYASNKQTNSLEDMAKRYEGYGAPYRQRLSDLYANPSSFLSSPEVKTSVDQGTNSLMRSLSMTGNPFGSGNALTQGQSYASDQLFGKLGQEKDRLAGFGGLSSYNAAAPGVATNAIGSSSNTYNALGSGLGNIFNPPKTEAQTMADFMKAMKG